MLLLAGAALCLYVVAALVVPAIFGRPAGGDRAVAVMAAVTGLSLLFSVLPVSLLGPLGVMPTVYGYFMGAAARIVICLVVAVLCTKLFALPPGPVMVTLAGMYLPLLFLETALVGRYLWKKDFLPKPGGETGGGAAIGARTKEALA